MYSYKVGPRRAIVENKTEIHCEFISLRNGSPTLYLRNKINIDVIHSLKTTKLKLISSKYIKLRTLALTMRYPMGRKRHRYFPSKIFLVENFFVENPKIKSP